MRRRSAWLAAEIRLGSRIGLVASSSAERTSLAKPRAYLAIRSAVAGATTMSSAHRPREVWTISPGAIASAFRSAR